MVKLLAQLLDINKNILNRLVKHINKEIAILAFVTLIMLLVFETLLVSLLMALFFLRTFVLA